MPFLFSSEDGGFRPLNFSSTGGGSGGAGDVLEVEGGQAVLEVEGGQTVQEL